MQGKTCQRCGKKQPYSMFDFSVHAPDGYVKRCKSCLAIQNALRTKAKKKGRKISFNDFQTLDGMRVFDGK